MKKTITSEIKKEQWGDGPWVDEPDMVEFEHEGFQCFILRTAVWEGKKFEHLYGGHLCGYVMIPEGHPWHGKDFFNEDIDVEIHGGITFSREKEGAYWIGFDCNHSYDISPSMENVKKLFPKLNEFEEIWRKKLPNSPIWNKSYKDIEYVKKECKSLAEQAKKAQDIQ